MQTPRICASLFRCYSATVKRSPPCTSHLVSCMRWTRDCNRSRLCSRAYSTDVISSPSIEGEGKDYSIKIQSLVNEISQLTLIEVADLNELLKQTLKITDAPMMAMGAMPAAQAPVEEEEAQATQQTAFAVKLIGFDDTKKVPLIKEIKATIAGMNLVQAKKFVESLPQAVRSDIPKQEAEDLQKALEAVGAKVVVE